MKQENFKDPSPLKKSPFKKNQLPRRMLAGGVLLLLLLYLLLFAWPSPN